MSNQGKVFLCDAESRNPSDVIQQECFIAYGPSSTLKVGSSRIITTTYSISGSAGVSHPYVNAKLSGTYSFSYQHQAPCSETIPLKQTDHTSAWEFSDNLDQTSIKPYAVCYEVSALSTGSFPNGMDSICVNDQEQVAHTGWFYVQITTGIHLFIM